MDYDVSLHDLVELVVIFETSPSSSKTDSECLSYYVFDVGDLSVLRVGRFHTSLHLIFSPLVILNIFVGYYMSLSFQQNWFHLIRSSVAQDIAVLVLAENMFLSAFTGSTASQGGSTASAFPSPVVPGHYHRRPGHLAVTFFFVPFLLSVVPVGLDRYYRPCGILFK